MLTVIQQGPSLARLSFSRFYCKKSDGPLGLEICPNLRLLAPHYWPHPIYILPYIFLLYIFPGHIDWIFFIITQLLAFFFVMIEKREYLKEINELPEQGFCPPDPPGIIHGTRTLLYNLYLKVGLITMSMRYKALLSPTSNKLITKNGAHLLF